MRRLVARSSRVVSVSCVCGARGNPTADSADWRYDVRWSSTSLSRAKVSTNYNIMACGISHLGLSQIISFMPRGDETKYPCGKEDAKTSPKVAPYV